MTPRARCDGSVPLAGQRAFRLLWVGETANVLGTNVAVVVLPLAAVVSLGASPVEIGLLAAATWLPTLVFSLPAGAWVDRRPRRRVMMACDAGTALTFVVVAAVAALGHLRMVHLVGAAFVAGTLTVLFTTAYRSYLPAVVAAAQLPAATAALQGAEWTARIAGSGVAGLVASLGGVTAGALVNSVSCLVSLACLAAIPPDRAPATSGARRPLTAEIMEGLRFVATDAHLRGLTTAAAVSALARGLAQAVTVLFLVRELGVSATVVGLLLTATGVGGVLGSLGVRRLAERVGSARALLLVNLVAAPCALLVPLSGPGPGLVLFAVGTLTNGAALVGTNVIVAGFRMTWSPPALLGRVAATMIVASFGPLPLGALAGGLLGQALGPRATLWVAACGTTVAAGMLLAGPFRTARELPRRASPPSGPPGHDARPS